MGQSTRCGRRSLGWLAVWVGFVVKSAREESATTQGERWGGGGGGCALQPVATQPDGGTRNADDSESAGVEDDMHCQYNTSIAMAAIFTAVVNSALGLSATPPRPVIGPMAPRWRHPVASRHTDTSRADIT